MRELKFRIWNKKFNCWDTIDSISGDFNEIFKMDCFIFQQYTGLTDKNGKEIYEGDIIHFYNDDSYTITDEILICEYSPNNAWFTFNENSDEEYNGYYWLEVRNLCEVIGNIFENPDLIK